MSFCYEFPRPALAVDCVVFGVPPSTWSDSRELRVILVKRGEPPFPGRWALPGGHVEMGETLETAAERELAEETGAKISYMEQLYTFGGLNRDPRGRVVSVAYFALVRADQFVLRGASDAIQAEWWDLKLALKPKFLAFDHREVLSKAVERLKGKVRYAPIGFHLLPPTFSLGELQTLYEIVLGRELDKSNFRKRVLKMGILAEADGQQTDVSHRPAKLYRFDKQAYDRAVRDGFAFEI